MSVVALSGTILAMTSQPIKTRFAPSPSGWLHVGNARAALFNALYAIQRGGRFLLRVEDTDVSRSRDAYRAILEQDLRWLGLQWDEGPDIGGPAAPYRQSQRGPLYATYLRELLEGDFAYPCFCTAEELQRSRREQLRAGRPPRYAGTCAGLSTAQTAARYRERPAPTLRFRIPARRTVEFEDLVRGPQRFLADDFGDFVIRRADGTVAFLLCNAIDDALMGVSDVLRGEDHLANTPRQLLLLEVLRLPTPRYGHLPMIVAGDGVPLAKRHGGFALRTLREQGYRPEAMVNYLGRLGHHLPHNRVLGITELAAAFSLERIGHSPARLDTGQLVYWQREVVRGLSATALWEWVATDRAVREHVPASAAAAFIAAIQGNIDRPADAAQWARRLFEEPLAMSDSAGRDVVAAGPVFFAAAIEALSAVPDDFARFAKAVGAATGRKGKALYMPLRAALSGQSHGPEMTRIFPLIGPRRARQRLLAAAKIATEGGESGDGDIGDEYAPS